VQQCEFRTIARIELQSTLKRSRVVNPSIRKSNTVEWRRRNGVLIVLKILYIFFSTILTQSINQYYYGRHSIWAKHGISVCNVTEYRGELEFQDPINNIFIVMALCGFFSTFSHFSRNAKIFSPTRYSTSI